MIEREREGVVVICVVVPFVNHLDNNKLYRPLYIFKHLLNKI
jgi:hypothetical protein